MSLFFSLERRTLTTKHCSYVSLKRDHPHHTPVHTTSCCWKVCIYAAIETELKSRSVSTELICLHRARWLMGRSSESKKTKEVSKSQSQLPSAECCWLHSSLGALFTDPYNWKISPWKENAACFFFNNILIRKLYHTD